MDRLYARAVPWARPLEASVHVLRREATAGVALSRWEVEGRLPRHLEHGRPLASSCSRGAGGDGARDGAQGCILSAWRTSSRGQSTRDETGGCCWSGPCAMRSCGRAATPSHARRALLPSRTAAGRRADGVRDPSAAHAARAAREAPYVPPCRPRSRVPRPTRRSSPHGRTRSSRSRRCALRVRVARPRPCLSRSFAVRRVVVVGCDRPRDPSGRE